MIQCKEAADLFTRYLDRELSGDDLKHIEEHLEKCKGCFGHYEFDKAVRQLVKKKAVEVQLSDELKKLITDKLKEA